MDWQVAGVSIAGVNNLGLLAICAIERDLQLPVAGKESGMVRIIRKDGRLVNLLRVRE